MGFLADPSAPVADFDKAVFSFWFRVPKASIDAAIAAYAAFYNGDGFSPSPFCGSIPLVSWGWQGDGSGPSRFTNDGGIVGGVPFGIAPSYIGLYAGAVDFSVNTSCSMYVRLQYNSQGTLPFGADIDTLTVPDAFEVGANNIADYSGTLTNPGATYSQIPITPDRWHHALISFDLSNGSSVGVSFGDPTIMTAASKFYWAIDDVNYNGPYVGPHGPSNLAGGGPNDIVSVMTGNGADRLGFDGYGAEQITPLGTVQCSGAPLPVAGYPFGFPSTAANSAAILKVELAEFQLFTGVTLDTSITANRRAFIDGDGKPVPPKYRRASDGTVSADPASPPFLLLGKLPDVALCQSSGNWIGGKSLGSAAAHFAKTGTVKPFTPDPKLGA